MERRARDAAQHGERVALFVYFSGHAKDGALRLGDTQLPLEALKSRLAQAPADVRIGIFDSCRSGLLTRTKGARKAPAFEIESKSARDAKGLVILTSSASDEDSQESDLIGGSYFSHHLASGLLGSADRSGDGRVTLFEAYAYAYDRTVADTAESAAGAQHPTFSYDLAGNGDLVLTDVGGRHEGLYFPRAAPSGVYFLVDGRGFVAAEVVKAADADRRIALAPGRYRVKRRLADRLRVGEVEIARGQLATLDENRLRDAPFADDPVKGAGARPRGHALDAGPGRDLSGDLRRAVAREPVPGDRDAGDRDRSCTTSSAATGSGASTSRPAAPRARSTSPAADRCRSSSASSAPAPRCWSSGRTRASRRSSARGSRCC